MTISFEKQKDQCRVEQFADYQFTISHSAVHFPAILVDKSTGSINTSG
jgi:hypothetical protein